jgi:hypothetical protein
MAPSDTVRASGWSDAEISAKRLASLPGDVNFGLASSLPNLDANERHVYAYAGTVDQRRGIVMRFDSSQCEPTVTTPGLMPE